MANSTQKEGNLSRLPSFLCTTLNRDFNPRIVLVFIRMKFYLLHTATASRST